MTENIYQLTGAALKEDLMVGAKSFIRNGTSKEDSIARLNAYNKMIGDTPVSLDAISAIYDEAYDAVTTPSCIRPLAECQIESVCWLIDDYIPAAEVTIVAGDGGAGKSTLVRNIITAVATDGKSSLFGDVNRHGKVLYYTAEDDVGKVVAGAMKQAGANFNNIGCLDAGHPMLSEYTFDSVLLENDIKKTRPVLVVFDPLQAFLDDRINMSSRNSMRHAMEPLKQLAKQYDTTFLILMHTNKRQQVSGRSRIADSSDIWDFARSVIIVGTTGNQTEDGKNVRYASLEKANYAAAEEIPTVLFTVEDRQVHLTGTSYKKDADYVMAAATTERGAPKLEEAKRDRLYQD